MIKVIRELEQRIVRAFVDKALAAGYRITVSGERGYDIDECLLGSSDAEKIMAEAFAGDDATLFIHKADEPLTENGRINCDGWVYIVLGNDGWDVVSDWTDNAVTNAMLEEAMKISDQYS